MCSVGKCDISFVIPVYNVEEFLEECLDSVIRQNGIKKEIIVVDDGSDDRSLEILTKYKKQNHNMILLQQNHQGASTARNKGIDAATGRWICFIDSDDYLEPDCMKNILKDASEDSDVIFADYVRIGFGKRQEFSYREENVEMMQQDFKLYQKAALNKNYNPPNLQIITPWAKLYRTDFLKKNQIRFTPGVRKSQDLLFNFEVYQVAERGKYIHSLMYYYRYNAESLCNKYLSGVLDDYLMQSRKIEALLKTYGKYDELRQDYYFRCAVNYMFSLRLDYVHRDNKKKYKKRKWEFEESLEIEDVKRAIYAVDKNEFSLMERILLESVRKKKFCLINFLYLGYGMIEKLR